MEMLGKIVTRLRVGNGWSMQDLAARVRHVGAKNVRYQHIQNLENKPNTSPRYLFELAAAFGKTVEELRSWHDGLPVFGPHAPGTVAEAAPTYPRSIVSADELDLLEHYRSCRDEMKRAIRNVAAAGAIKA